MEQWLDSALTYVQSWLGFQHRAADLPGLQFAAVHQGKLIRQFSIGVASLVTGEALTPEHRLRVASHSKSFTAAGILRLVDSERLRLDDCAGDYVAGLHPDTAEVTIAQLLSHTAGVVRDGPDAGQWQRRRPFLDAGELLADLARAPVLTANTRFKYSNHGLGLLGLIIERITGEPYAQWMAREVVAAAGLHQTQPDAPVAPEIPLADGHGSRTLLGQRFAVPIGDSTRALAAATGFVSTAGDLARFFWQLSPGASRSFLSATSRREMVRRQWRVPDQALERHYGLGLIQGGVGEWSWFGHSGVYPGVLSHTSMLPAQDLSLSLIINAVDLQPMLLIDGAIEILRAFAGQPPAPAAHEAWSGRWWSHWGAFDVIPIGDRLMVGTPALANPLADASVIELDSAEQGRIVRAGGFLQYGEGARLQAAGGGLSARSLWLGGNQLLQEADAIADVKKTYSWVTKG